ncbi:hypothetical protein VTJ49DRAFT_3441 [Mycothermus thermophilus]|uniref:Uncharacterized protein n=1 Tax=Humicola insolens TaxID=85995 RepID=A0ABR3V7I4_HUMIN
MLQPLAIGRSPLAVAVRKTPRFPTGPFEDGIDRYQNPRLTGSQISGAFTLIAMQWPLVQQQLWTAILPMSK